MLLGDLKKIVETGELDGLIGEIEGQFFDAKGQPYLFDVGIRSLIENVPADSIVLITFNGNDWKYGQRPADRPGRLKTLLGSVVPDGLTPDA